MSDEFTTRLKALDVALLGAIESQTTIADRRSLLALHDACRTVFPTFTWLEIGSHLGGSLQALVRDPRCTRIISIDPRPADQPDARGPRYPYEGNSTQRMMDLLAAIPGAVLAKIETIEASTEDLDSSAIGGRPQVCFIDGEHTHEAALRDARFCREVMQDSGCVAFHDAWVVHRGIDAFLEDLRRDGAPHHAYLMPDMVLVVELGELRLRGAPRITELVLGNATAYLASIAAAENTWRVAPTAG